MAIIDWDNTLRDDNWEADVGNLYRGAQGPCPDRLLCKSEDQSWQVILKDFWSIFENIFSLDVVRAWFMWCYLEVLCNSDGGMCPGGDQTARSSCLDSDEYKDIEPSKQDAIKSSIAESVALGIFNFLKGHV